MRKFISTAHYGMRDWLFQRVTAIVMALYTVFFIAMSICFGIDGFESWRGLFSMGIMKFSTFIFLICLIVHAWVGMRDIVMDYIQPMILKLPLLSAVGLVLVGFAGWSAMILWRL